ncbi:MAG: hypothetical protein LBG52_00830 [Candidatus Peribacteria bacterium]|jgi:hypothetical protein|nr:hypothetical protein [Candidatus Peribacteria bacterium]
MLFAEGKQIQKDSKEGQELFKLLVEFDYLYMSEHTPFSDFEKFKKDLKKMLVINGQEVTPEADGAGYKNLGTASGMAEYKFSGLLPT